MKKFLQFTFLVIALITIASVKTSTAQCTSCTVTNPVLSGNYTFSAGSKVCFTSNATLSDVTFQNNSTICVAQGVTVFIQNNVNTNSSNTINFEVNGILQFNQPAQINSSSNINIGANGILRAGSNGTTNFTLNGATNNLANNGKLQVGVLQFQNNNSVNQLDNYYLMSIANNINISGTTTFRNWDTLNIGQSYNNNSTSSFINCAVMNNGAGYNLGGGKIINSGFFNVPNSSIDFGSNGRFYNYGEVVSGGTANTTNTSILYNEGLFKMNNFQGDGKIQGPPTGSGKRGFIYLTGTPNRLNINQNTFGPNLDFTYTPGTTLNGDGRPNTTKPGAGQNGTNQSTNRQYLFQNFNGSFLEVNTITFDCQSQGNCPQPLVTVINQCPNWDGSFADLAVDASVSKTQPNAGNTVTFTINVANFGPNNTTGVLVDALLPSGYTFISSNTTAGSYNHQTGVWNVGALNLNGTQTLTITARVNHTGNYLLETSVEGDQADPTLANNTDQVGVTPRFAYGDNSTTFVNTIVAGDVSANESLEPGTVYSSAFLQSSPQGSNPSLNLNNDGTYDFESDVAGVYEYRITYCAPSQQAPCPTQLLSITVIDTTTLNLPNPNIDLAITQLNQAVTLQTLVNDLPGSQAYALNPASVSIITNTAPNPTTQGSLSVNPANGNITFTPVNGFTGTITYSYEVCDVAPIPNCAISEQEITVLPANAENVTMASDDFIMTLINTQVSGNALTNDIDPFGFSQTVAPQSLNLAGIGTFELLANGSFSFVPVLNYVGILNVPYTVCNDGSPQACANAVITIVSMPPFQPLPVKLTTFNAFLTSSGNGMLQWQTAIEQNNHFFVIERSANGKDFEPIGQVYSKATNGNSNYKIDYSFIDKNVIVGNNYYRLKQVDFDYTTAFSNVRLLKRSQQEIGEIKVTPNPTNGYALINFAVESEVAISLVITNSLGQVVENKYLQVQAGQQNIETNLNNHQAGIYFVTLTTNGFAKTTKIVKTK